MDLLFLRSGSTGRQGFRVTYNPYWPSAIAGAEALLRSVHSGLVWVGENFRRPAACTAARWRRHCSRSAICHLAPTMATETPAYRDRECSAAGPTAPRSPGARCACTSPYARSGRQPPTTEPAPGELGSQAWAPTRRECCAADAAAPDSRRKSGEGMRGRDTKRRISCGLGEDEAPRSV